MVSGHAFLTDVGRVCYQALVPAGVIRETPELIDVPFYDILAQSQKKGCKLKLGSMGRSTTTCVMKALLSPRSSIFQHEG